MLEGLNEFIKKQNDINNIIIAGDLNEDIESKEVKRFSIERGLFDIYGIINTDNNSKRESIYLYRSKCIDTITTTTELLQCVDGYKIVEYNKVILTNHMGYMVDFNLEWYFECKNFNLDQVDSLKLDSKRASHKVLFIEKVEEYIN